MWMIIKHFKKWHRKNTRKTLKIMPYQFLGGNILAGCRDRVSSYPIIETKVYCAHLERKRLGSCRHVLLDDLLNMERISYIITWQFIQPPSQSQFKIECQPGKFCGSRQNQGNYCSCLKNNFCRIYFSCMAEVKSGEN